jgi:Mg-chelatase subunit ChlD
VNQVEFEGHSLWSAVNQLRENLIRADQVAGPEQWHVLDQVRFDQLQYVISGIRSRRPPPEAAAAATATLDRLHGVVSAAADELGQFLADRATYHLAKAARLVDEALNGLGPTPQARESRRVGPYPGRQPPPVATTAPPEPEPQQVATTAPPEPEPQQVATTAPPEPQAAVATAAGAGGGNGRPHQRSHARHAKRSHTRGVAIAIAVLAFVAALGTVVAFGATGGDSSDGGTGCTRLRVVTAASYEPALDAVADELANGDGCVRLDVTVADGRNAESIVDQVQAHVWIADDASWLERYEAEEAEEYGADSEEADLSYLALASSPVLFASSPAMAASIQRAGGGWAGLAALVESDQPASIVTKDPASTGDGLAAIGGLGDAIWDSQGMDASALLLAQAYRLHRTASDVLASGLAAGEVGLVPEHVLGANVNEDPVITTPSDRTVLMRYSWYETEVDATAPAIRTARAQALSALTEGTSADAAREAAHLRDAHGAPPETPDAEDTWVGQQLPPANPVMDAHKVDHVFATWYAADRLADVLVVVDVSGSMATPVPGSNQSLTDLVQQNVAHLAGQLPSDARLGVWGFGSRLDGARDYVIVDQLRPLTPDHRRSLPEKLARLEPRDTGTGLYDTVLAAYQSALVDARPNVPFHVMVFTDGRNQDDPRAMTTPELRQALAEVADPEAAVGLTVVQVGDRSPTRLANALRPVAGEVVTIDSADAVVASFIHLAAGGLHS